MSSSTLLTNVSLKSCCIKWAFQSPSIPLPSKCSSASVQSTLYSNIVKEPRTYPNCFRVGYYGRGFPSTVQNRQFVYRGNEHEKLGAYVTFRLPLFFASLNHERQISRETYEQARVINLAGFSGYPRREHPELRRTVYPDLSGYA